MIDCYQKLKGLRKSYGYTCADMANILEISKCFYWQLENKKRRLYYEVAIQIADIFNLKPDDIFYEKKLK